MLWLPGLQAWVIPDVHRSSFRQQLHALGPHQGCCYPLSHLPNHAPLDLNSCLPLLGPPFPLRSDLLCGQVLAGPPEQQPLQAVMEVKAVGEVITLKICTLLLHTGREVEAVGWFRNYVEWFRSRLGPPQGAFLHWTWMSRQYEVFGELLYQRLQVTGKLGDAPGVADVLPAPGAAPALGVASAGGLSREPSGPSGLLLLPEVRSLAHSPQLSQPSRGTCGWSFFAHKVGTAAVVCTNPEVK